MANLSWLFYKGYYKGLSFAEKAECDKKETKPVRKAAIEKNMQELFNQKNRLFTGATLPAYTDNITTTTNSITAYTTYPGLLIGTGYTHEIGVIGEFKIGFHFDYTTGIPIIPGSSIKGMLRSIFPQFEGEEKKCWKIDEVKENKQDVNLYAKKKAKAKYVAAELGITGTDEEIFTRVHELELEIFEGLDVKLSQNQNAVNEKAKPQYHSIYKRDIFHDAYPVSAGKNKHIFGTDSITPHIKEGKPYYRAMLENPVPLLFLKVLPNVGYRFNFKLTDTLTTNGVAITAQQKQALFNTLITTFGVGAKTNVGYGQFTTAPTHKPDDIEQIPQRDFETYVPANVSDLLRKGKQFEGQIIEMSESEVNCLFIINKIQVYIPKKKKKLKGLPPEVGKNVTLVMMNDYQIGADPNCQITVTN